ncbi:hypothetical protein LTS10_010348 [Elasticomyces elasticus]|nr:hypothetical protein LTS10_010348 [Elasticomyces elasticus]
MPPRVRLTPKTSVRFPGLNSPPNYKSFLENFSALPENKRALPALDKNDIDQQYEALLRKKFQHEDDKEVSRHMQIVRSEEGQRHWERIKTAGIQAYGSYIVSPEVTDLRLPALGQHIKNATGPGRANDHLDRQTYKDFADKAMKDNPTVTFTKQIMDDAFRHGGSKLDKAHKVGSNLNPAGVAKMLKRCLGKESDQYWQKRTG